jgi:pilus assembly protein Flp/PilA
VNDRRHSPWRADAQLAHVDHGSGDMTALNRFLKNEDGATVIEYGLIVAIIGVGVLVSVAGYGEDLAQLYTDIWTAVSETH